jgi:hypothetical protein
MGITLFSKQIAIIYLNIINSLIFVMYSVFFEVRTAFLE